MNEEVVHMDYPDIKAGEPGSKDKPLVTIGGPAEVTAEGWDLSRKFQRRTRVNFQSSVFTLDPEGHLRYESESDGSAGRPDEVARKTEQLADGFISVLIDRVDSQSLKK